MKVKDLPSYSTYFNPLPTMPEIRVMKPKTFVPMDSYGSIQQKTLPTEFLPTSYSRTLKSNVIQPTSTYGQQTQGFTHQTEKSLQRTEQYGQPIASRLAVSEPYSTTVDSYQTYQPERMS